MSVGKPLPHDAAHLHVTGAARYIDDIPTPAGTLHLAFGLSDVAAGTITEMDLTPVRDADGVVAVLTAADLPFANDVSPSAHDEPLLSDGAVHYMGQPLFLVVATSHGAARRAARLGDVTISPKEPILTIDAALAAESRFEDGPRVWTKGAVDEALNDARHRLQGTIEIGGQEHFYLEGQAALALPQEDGDMVIHSSTQHPTEIQHKVADALGKPMHAVRSTVRRMGGGFGGKESQGNALAVACAVAADRTGHPCKMRYDRDDDMVITGKRHDFRISYDAGFDDQGRICGVDFTQLTRCGWALDLSIPVADRAMLHADNAYDLPHVRITSHRLRTNTQSATAFRGFGGPQGIVGIERVMDHIAHDRGLDPVVVRQVNYYDEMADVVGGAAPQAAPAPRGISEQKKGNVTPYGMPVTDFILGQMTDALLVTSDYAARRAAVAAWNAQSDILKRGIGFSPVKFGISFTLTHLNQAEPRRHRDGARVVPEGRTGGGQCVWH